MIQYMPPCLSISVPSQLGRYIPMRLVPPAGTCLPELTMCCILKLYWDLMLMRVWKLLGLLHSLLISVFFKLGSCSVNFVIYLVTGLVELCPALGQSAGLSAVSSREAVLKLKRWCARRAAGRWCFWGKNLKYGLASFLTITFHLGYVFRFGVAFFFLCVTCTDLLCRKIIKMPLKLAESRNVSVLKNIL